MLLAHFLLLLILLIKQICCAPLISKDEVDKSLDHFLHLYYNKFVKSEIEAKLLEYFNSRVEVEDIYERMQGDQPIENAIQDPQGLATRNDSEAEYFRTMRDRFRDSSLDERTRDSWLKLIKNNILQQIGRHNMTEALNADEDLRIPDVNITEMLPTFLNTSFLNDDQITEKIRSFYPSCELPGNTDHDLWKDDNVMNLYFNFNYSSDEKNANIATATLRLYRLPENSTKIAASVPGNPDCEPGSSEEEKLLRVSIYWYTKSLRKRRVRRRLSDSKVISENMKWVELSVKPATKAWSKGKNLGLGVLVEDQEGNALKADKYFKGASCMVGTSTPKPIPTIITDAARKTNEFHQINSLLRGNSTAALHSDVQLLPIIDICRLEFPENYTVSPSHISNLRINACNLKKLHEQSQKMAEKEQIERLATLPELSSHHRRHHRQHGGVAVNKLADSFSGSAGFDVRSKIVNPKVVMTNEQLQKLQNQYQFNLTSSSSNIKR